MPIQQKIAKVQRNKTLDMEKIHNRITIIQNLLNQTNQYPQIQEIKELFKKE
jgi:hypothetical protein